jgi:hypothetical protein
MENQQVVLQPESNPTKLIKNEEENYKKFVYFSVTICAVLYSITPHFL